MTTIIVLVNFPMNLVGTLLGYKSEPISTPTKTSRVPRTPPEGLPWFLNLSLMSVVSGCVPVFVIGFEIYQILYCIRGTAYIYLIYWSFYFGFIVFAVVIAELAVMQTYLVICYEEYRWWWRSWLLGASTGVVSFLLFLNYFLLAMKADQLATFVVYTVYCALFSAALGLMSGSIALLSSFVFNLKIFESARRDE